MKTTLLLASCAAIIAPAAFAVDAQVVVDKTVKTFKLLGEAGDICKQATEGTITSEAAVEKITAIEGQLASLKKEMLELEAQSQADGSAEDIKKRMEEFMTGPEGQQIFAGLGESFQALATAAQGPDEALKAAVTKLMQVLNS